MVYRENRNTGHLFSLLVDVLTTFPVFSIPVVFTEYFNFFQAQRN